jgi:hypothetical protein
VQKGKRVKEIEVASRRIEPVNAEDWEAAEDTPEGWRPIEVPIKDPETKEVVHTLVAYPPGEGQLVAFMTTSASWTTMPERIAGAMEFMVSLVSEEDHGWIVRRLLDRQDPFGGTHVLAIIEGLMEEWSGRPTERPSGSSPSRRTGGRKSTRPTPALT